MSAPTLIGWSGYAGSGKDTAALLLVDLGWTRLSFADVLREFALAVDPLIPLTPMLTCRLSQLVTKMGWENAKRTYPEVRQLLQRLGTDAGRRLLGTDVWVNAAFERVPAGAPVTATDVRFPNEAEAIRARGGIVVRVERPGTYPINGHPSETALDSFEFDAVLVNDGTVLDLHAKVAALLTGAGDSSPGPT